MSESINVEGGSATPEQASSAGNQEVKDSDTTALHGADQSVSYSTHKRLLKEKKNAVSELNELKATLKMQEMERIEKEGEYKEAFLRTKAELEDARNANKQLQESHAWSALNDKIKNVAVSQGLKSEAVDDFIDLLNKQDLKEIELTDYDPTEEDLQRLVETKKKAKSYMFRAKTSPVDDLAPAAKVEKSKPKKMTLADMENELRRRNQQK